MPLAVHPPGLDHQHHRPAAALADASGRFTVGRQVNVMAIAAQKALLADRVEKSLHGAVIEQFGRFDRHEAQIHLDTVPLVRPDEPAVRREGEPLLVVRGDNFFQLLTVDRLPMAARRSQEFVDRHPTLGVQRDADRLGIVAEYEAEELADCKHYFFIQSLRAGRLRRALAASSPGNDSLFGSHFNLRPSSMAMLPMCIVVLSR